ncbi:hypothetical protein SNE40_022210 [Patella caerulea]|uniref:Sorting nexin 13 n=1 Tax=Patella caerulea TaxID=87958 RepID=A0AAN8G3H3_PATCE
MNLLGGNWKWVTLGLGLFFATFGSVIFLIIFYTLIFISGFLVIAHFYGQQKSEDVALFTLSTLALPSTGVYKITRKMNSVTKIKNFDKRMTGASVIDDVLKELLEFTIRDYIKTWYRTISDHDAFHVNIWQCVQKVVITFAHRTKEIDWMPYFTQRLVDDFASHIRLYRRVLDKKKRLPPEEAQSADIEELFFDLEVDMEDNMCRDLICLDPQAEKQYLQDLSDVLLFLLLSKEDFYNKPFRFIMREVLVNGVFIPTIDLLSDPDYINQYIAWLCQMSSFTKETFLTVIKNSESLEELEAVELKVEADITKWRAKDSGGNDDTLVKQNLNSLRFVKDTCKARIKRLQEGPLDSESLPEEPEFLKYHNLYILTLDDIMENNIALQAFIEFMTSKGGEQILFFYLNVEGFRTAAEQQITEAHKSKQTSNKAVEPDLQSLRRAAMIIYDQYLGEKATIKMKLPTELIKRTLQNIKDRMLSEDVFDAVQSRVYQILHSQYYEEFLQSNYYVKLLSELGMLKGSKTDDGDTISLDDVPRILWFKAKSDDLLDNPMDQSPDTLSLDSVSSASSCGTQSGDSYISGQITQTGIVKETGKTYAIFAITVRRKTPDSEEETVTDVYRRYSDFHDLNMLIIEACPSLKGPQLPGKTVLKNMNQEFLEKRRKALDSYLRKLQKPELWSKFPVVEDLVTQFLAPGLWEKHKSEIARKMDTFVNPLRSSVKHVGQAVKNVPDGITDGFGKMFKANSNDISGTRIIDRGKVGKGLDPDDEENIPVRIMLLLMDEVFDLRHKNQSIRRMILVLLRQLISATFGDKINRKIVDHVDLMTSAEQMSEYLKAFRDSFWPNGNLAEPRITRDVHTKYRTQVYCKAKMLGSVPDELKTVLGADVVRMGVGRIFDMFQHKNLNKRILYVCLEGVLETMFSSNKFAELFRKLHSQSKRVQKVKAEKKK